MAADGRCIKFVQLFLNGESATRAYMQAYENDNYESSAACASALLKTTKVKDLFKVMLPELGMDLKELGERLAMEARTGETSLDRVRALDKIARIHGAYTENVNLNVTGNITWREFVSGDNYPEG